jgi:phospholipid/cholesterol/gamma-HCH transport system permease protein
MKAGGRSPGMALGLAVEDGRITLTGEWRLRNFEERILSGLVELPPSVTVDLGKVTSLDTGSAYLLLEALGERELQFVGAEPDVKRIMQVAASVGRGENSELRVSSNLLSELGRAFAEGGASFLVLLSFIGQTLLSGGELLLNPLRVRFKELFVQLEQCAIRSVPVVSLVMLLIGVVIAYLFAGQMERYGANIFIVDGVSIAICRELSPVIVAIIVAGRSGSAFTAQLGTMKLNEEVDALTTMGLSVMRVLIMPRVVALILSLPILVALGDVVGIFGGSLIAQFRLGIEPETFVQRMQDVLKLKHVIVGLIKAPVFAAFIAVIGCKMGLTVENNARSIGLSTTSTVVQSIVSVILLNAAFAVLFMEMGV